MTGVKAFQGFVGFLQYFAFNRISNQGNEEVASSGSNLVLSKVLCNLSSAETTESDLYFCSSNFSLSSGERAGVGC